MIVAALKSGLAIAALVGGIAALAAPGAAMEGQARGERQALTVRVWTEDGSIPPDGATITVTLEDVARMDVAADVVTWAHAAVDHAPPYDISVHYDPQRLNEKGRYALRVRIEQDGRLLYINTYHVAAFDGPPDRAVAVKVTPVGR